MSDCACLTSNYDGYNESTLYTKKKILSTRKPHRCCECRKIIPSKSPCVVESGYSDEFWRYYTCELCDELRGHFFCSGAYLFGELWEGLQEQLWEGGAFKFECLSGLGIPAREFVLARWRQWKGLDEGRRG